MHSNILTLLARRKLSVLLFSSSLILVALWTWTFSGINRNIPETSSFLAAETSNKQEYILEKLISQANRVIRYQRQFRVTEPSNPSEDVELEAKTEKKSVEKYKKAPLVGENILFEDERLKILENQQRSRIIGMEDNNNLINNMDYERELSSAERQTQYERDLQRMGVPVVAGIGPDDPHVPRERLVHLDLKGAPPKLSFLKQLLPVLHSLGATGFLIEYEDMFPYTGALQALSARNAYNSSELRDFLESAAMHGLSVMPLVQTFGHLEFALKLQEFQQLREIPESPQSICPSKSESISFIEDMITQVIEFHLSVNALSNNSSSSLHSGLNLQFDSPGNFTHIHIGCDEVYRMGVCDKCRQRGHHEIFLTHVTTISNFVRTKWPQLKVVIWDDMLRDMTLSEMEHSQVGRYVEPMIWVYSKDIYQFIQPHLWDIYSKVFPTAWAASAFKGAFGESLMIPPLQRHLENNIRWLAVIAKEGERFSKGFKGLALTGWQRYDHFAVICEILPTAFPSLITSLSTVSKGYFCTDPKDNAILRVLQCAFHPDMRRSGHAWIELHPNSHHSQLFSSCDYPGSLIYKYSLRLYEKLMEAQTYLGQVQDRSAWMSSYNVRHNFSSPLRVRDLTINTPTIINDLTSMAKEAHSFLLPVYDEHTIAEFIEQNIYPVIVSLHKHLENGNTLLQRNIWPQRPLPYAHEMLSLNLIPSEPEKSNN